MTASGKESWYYSVDKGINLVSLAGSMIPVTGASQAADAVDKSSQKDSNSLMIFFDEKGVVENWCVKISNNLLNYIEKGE